MHTSQREQTGGYQPAGKHTHIVCVCVCLFVFLLILNPVYEGSNIYTHFNCMKRTELSFIVCIGSLCFIHYLGMAS